MKRIQALTGWRRLLAEYALITLGVGLMAFSISCFFNPHTIAPGGTPGLSVLVNRLAGLPLSASSLLMNCVLLALAVLLLGKSYGHKTVYVVVLTALLLKLIPGRALLPSPLLSAVCGSLIAGTGIGVTLCCRATAGGTSIVALILHKYFPRLRLQWYVMMVDGLVVALTTLFTRDLTTFLTSALSVLMIGRLIGFLTDRFLPDEEGAP